MNKMNKTNISIFKDLFKSQDVPFIVPLEKCFERIRRGTSKELIDKIQKAEDPEQKRRLKNKLPSILFAGEFQERKSSGLLKHSGLMVVDFDKYPDKKTMKKHFAQLKKNPHFVTLFISPSGNGIKGVVKVPNNLTKETHPQYFKAFQKKYNYDYFDIANSNVDRVCFESYDPNIYINYDAKIFVSKLKDEGFKYTEKISILPIDSENEKIDKIMKFDWEKSFSKGERNAYIFDLAGAFCEYGIQESVAESYIFNNVVSGNFSQSETRTTIKSAYRKREFDSKYFEDYSKIKRIKNDLKNGKKEVVEKHKISEVVFDIIKESKDHDDFWYFQKKLPQIDTLKYKWFLERNGFKKYYANDSSDPIFVKVESNKVRITSTQKIKDFVLDYLLLRNELEIWNKCVKYANLFSEQFLGMLESIELIMLRDQKEKSFLAFNNGILEVTKTDATLIDYIDVNGYVWESQIIKRDFELLENNDNEYKTFIKNISGDNPEAIETVVGYLLSTYKNKMNNKAIILNDEVISDNPEGGTGKGLFVQGLKQIRRVSILDGKLHDDKKSFAFQTVSQETQILVFDDVKKNFAFETKFSLVTEGMTLEQKNKDAITLSVEDSPKMVISTNYAIKGEGNSHERRRHEIEISQFYGKEITPFDEFGRQLFDDWNENEFNSFDNYMVYCLQLYLKKGLIVQYAKNITLRKFIAGSSMEFYEWIEDVENFPRNNRNDKAVMFVNFTNDYKDFNKWLSRKRFNTWVKNYAKYIGKKYNEGNSNGARWFEIEDLNNVTKRVGELEF